MAAAELVRERLHGPVEAALGLAALQAARVGPGSGQGLVVGAAALLLIVAGVRVGALLALGRRGGRRRLAAGHRRGQLALEAGRVHGQAGRAALQARISAHAEPVADTGFLDEHQPVRRVLANGCAND